MSFEDDPGREEDELDAGDKVRKEWGWSMVDVTSRVFGIGKDVADLQIILMLDTD